jgi:hypothetical protein
MSTRKHRGSWRLIAVLLVTSLAVAGMLYGPLNTVHAQQTRSTAVSTRQVWEYKVVFVPGSNWFPEQIEPQLNKLGTEGWELSTTGMATGVLIYTFKRPK